MKQTELNNILNKSLSVEEVYEIQNALEYINMILDSLDTSIKDTITIEQLNKAILQINI